MARLILRPGSPLITSQDFDWFTARVANVAGVEVRSASDSYLDLFGPAVRLRVIRILAEMDGWTVAWWSRDEA